MIITLLAVVGYSAWYKGKSADQWIAEWIEDLSPEKFQVIVHELGPQAIPPLLKKMEEGDSKVLGRASGPLMMIMNAETTAFQKREDGSWSRESGPRRFESHDWQIAIRALEEALSSPNQEVHQWAASFLGDIGPPAKHAGPALSKLLASPRYEARYTAAEAIGKIGSGDSITVRNLIELVKRENTNIDDWTPQIVRFTNSGRTGVIPKIVLKS